GAGEADLPLVDHIDAVATGPQVGPGRAGVGGLLQPLVEDRDRQPQGLDGLGLAPGDPAPGPVLGEGDPRPLGQDLQRLGEADALRALHESEHVAAFAAPEAVVQAPGAVDGHRRRLLLVERADGHEGAPAATHLGHLGDQVDDVGRLADPIAVAISHGPLIRIAARRRTGDQRSSRPLRYSTSRSIDTRSWAMVSRLRTVTALSSSDWKSSVTK